MKKRVRQLVGFGGVERKRERVYLGLVEKMAGISKFA
jgi:hypothetical protein